MKDSGCVSLSFGIESADNRVLESMEKHTTIEKVEEALEMSREAGICPFGNLLLGEVADDKESFQKNLEWFLSHPDIRLGFNKILVLPGSKLYSYAVANGFIKDEVAYLEEENYTINITRMTDDEYKECTRIMDETVARREYPLNDVVINRFDDKSGTYDGKGTCPLCGKNIKLKTRDFIGTAYGSCMECGRPFTVSLFDYFKKEMEMALQMLWNDKNIMLWGMGEEGYKMVYRSSILRSRNVFFADRNQNKQRKMGVGRNIYSPEYVLNRYVIDIVLIGTNAPVTNAAIKKEVLDHYPEIEKVSNLNEYLYWISREEKLLT